MVDLLAVGLSHRTASLELRERLAIPSRELPAALSSLRNSFGIAEAVVLSTCNRAELYVITPDHPSTFRSLVGFLSHSSGLVPEAFCASLYHLVGHEAVAHLFRVAAGLDSMVLGESEVTAQVKQAYAIAHAMDTTGPVLNRLFQKALHSAKEIRSQTRIAEGQASIGSVVAALAGRIFGKHFARCEILLWGAGQAAYTTARHLMKAGMRNMWVVSRTQAKAQDLATLCQGGWLSWEQAIKHLAHVDIAIVCTQAPHYVIDESDVSAIRSRRGARPLFIIDLAVPRNVDPTIAQQPGVHLYTMDALQAIAQEAVAQRRGEREHCEAIIQEQVGLFRRGAWNMTSVIEEGTASAVGFGVKVHPNGQQ